MSIITISFTHDPLDSIEYHLTFEELAFVSKNKYSTETVISSTMAFHKNDGFVDMETNIRGITSTSLKCLTRLSKSLHTLKELAPSSILGDDLTSVIVERHKELFDLIRKIADENKEQAFLNDFRFYKKMESDWGILQISSLVVANHPVYTLKIQFDSVKLLFD